MRRGDVTGTITVGKRADLVLLRTDRIGFAIQGTLADRVLNFGSLRAPNRLPADLSAPGHYSCFPRSGAMDVIWNTEYLECLSLLVCNIVLNRERSAL
jgi:hypothetical protein